MVSDAPASNGNAHTKRRVLAVASLVGFLTALAIGVALWTTWPRPVGRPTSAEFPAHTPCRDGVPVFPECAAAAPSLPTARASPLSRSRMGRPGCGFGPFVSLTARELQGTDGAKFPFWSPDSRAIGFFTQQRPAAHRRIWSGGGCTCARTRCQRRHVECRRDDCVQSQRRLARFTRSATSGRTPPTPLTTLLASETSHRWPKFLPDGRTLLYFVQGTTGRRLSHDA